MAVPPAWTDVWISPLSDSHLQATGRDAKGRKQFRYHPSWREVRDQNKYDRLTLFGRTLPKLRMLSARMASGTLHPPQTAVEFWKEFDAQKAAAPK